MSKGQTLQDPFLNALRKDRIPVSIFLVNGIKLQGQIESFDQYVVLLKNTVSQMVYKHAISTIVPVRNPRTGTDLSAPITGYQGSNASTGYPMSGGTFERQANFDRGYNNPSHNTQRGGFTRTSNTGFNSGFDRSGYQNQSYDNRGNGFERPGYNTGFDRSAFEERGFDGKAFDEKVSLDFDKKSFGNDE